MELRTESTATPQAGDVLRLGITDLAFGGEGVARVGNFVLFVPFTLVGEEVEAVVTEVKKNFARGRLQRVLQASPDRVAPACPYFGQCGGCQYQHLDYPAQLQLKHKQVVDVLQRIGGFTGEIVAPTVACPRPYAYRNRIMVRSQWDKFKRALNLGFVRADCGLVVDVEECRIAEPELNRQLAEFRAHPPPKGGIKGALRIYPPDWEVPRDSFFQNNFAMLPALIDTVRAGLRQTRVRFLVDAYCGVGFFSIALAGQIETFVGVEYDHQAVKAARLNAVRHQRLNGEFIAGKTEECLPAIMRRFPREATAVILDPPRTGCRPSALELLREIRPAQVLYVSCQPATLARDLNALGREGVYELVNVTPIDMFPQTQHIECIADLRISSPRPSA